MGKSKTRRWTKQRVIEEIKNLKNLSPKSVQKTFPSLYGAGVRIFGSWRRAISAAGKEYVTGSRKMPGFWNKDLVIQKIVLLPHKHSSYVRKNFTALYSAALRLFGSWKSAVESAGIDYETIKKGWISDDSRGLRFTRKL